MSVPSKLLVRLRRLCWNCMGYFQRRFGEQAVLLAVALLIGAFTAFGAALIHVIVVKIEQIGFRLENFEGPSWSKVLCFGGFLLLPLVGLLLSYLVQRFWGGPRYAKSLSPLILALNRRHYFIPGREMITHWLSSAFAVGCGGSAGLEAPSALTGAAIGTNTGGFFRIERRHRSLLIGCGAAAAISAIFGSPIGGVLFAVEVLLPGFSVGTLVPILMSSAVATVVSRMIANQFCFSLAITVPWKTNAVPFYFLCGVFCALIGVFMIRSAYRLTGVLKKRLRNPWVRLFTGGGALCLLLTLFPLLRGQGYFFIEQLFTGNLKLIGASSPLLTGLAPQWVIVSLVIFSAIFIKVAVSVLTVESGGDGGIFAPAMFTGAFSGFAFARLVNLSGLIDLQEPNFIVVGMCGVFTAVMRAPLTGIFLIAEVTGGYILLVPLMIVSAVSWFTARLFEPHSIYRKALAEGKLLEEDRDRAMLQSLPVRLNIDHDFRALSARDSLRTLSEILDESHREIYPVLDEQGRLSGIVRLEKILSVMLTPEMYDSLLVFDLMERPPCILSAEDDLAWAMANFEKFKFKYLPVRDADGKFAGFLAAAAIFDKYRGVVRETDTF